MFEEHYVTFRAPPTAKRRDSFYRNKSTEVSYIYSYFKSSSGNRLWASELLKPPRLFRSQTDLNTIIFGLREASVMWVMGMVWWFLCGQGCRFREGNPGWFRGSRAGTGPRSEGRHWAVCHGARMSRLLPGTPRKSVWFEERVNTLSINMVLYKETQGDAQE